MRARRRSCNSERKMGGAVVAGTWPRYHILKYILHHLKSWRSESGLTAAASPKQPRASRRERFLAAGFDGYVSKPVNVVAFVHVVKRLCDARSIGTFEI